MGTDDSKKLLHFKLTSEHRCQCKIGWKNVNVFYGQFEGQIKRKFTLKIDSEYILMGVNVKLVARVVSKNHHLHGLRREIVD